MVVAGDTVGTGSGGTGLARSGLASTVAARTGLVVVAAEGTGAEATSCRGGTGSPTVVEAGSPGGASTLFHCARLPSDPNGAASTANKQNLHESIGQFFFKGKCNPSSVVFRDCSTHY